MAWDLSVDLIKATVQLEQPLGDGTRTVGTGFLINAPTPDGKPRTVLVTAGHVLDRMPIATAKIGKSFSTAATSSNPPAAAAAAVRARSRPRRSAAAG